jgi:transposase
MLAMIRAALTSLIDQKLTTIREISELTGVSDSTVYRWINDGSQPTFDAIRLLIRKLNPDAQRVLLSALTSGTPWQLHHTDSDLDVNADGRVDMYDALDSVVQMMQDAGQSLAHIRDACRSGNCSREELTQVLHRLDAVLKSTKTAQQVITTVADELPQRKQAKR